MNALMLCILSSATGGKIFPLWTLTVMTDGAGRPHVCLFAFMRVSVCVNVLGIVGNKQLAQSEMTTAEAHHHNQSGRDVNPQQASETHKIRHSDESFFVCHKQLNVWVGEIQKIL